MNLSVLSTNNINCNTGRLKNANKSRKADSAESLQNKIKYLEKRIIAEKEYLNKHIHNTQEINLVNATLYRLNNQAMFYKNNLLKLLTKKI